MAIGVLDLASRTSVRRQLADEAAKKAESRKHRKRLLGSAWARMAFAPAEASDEYLVKLGREGMGVSS